MAIGRLALVSIVLLLACAPVEQDRAALRTTPSEPSTTPETEVEVQRTIAPSATPTVPTTPAPTPTPSDDGSGWVEAANCIEPAKTKLPPDGLSVTVALRKALFDRGEPVRGVVRLSNHGDEPVTIRQNPYDLIHVRIAIGAVTVWDVTHGVFKPRPSEYRELAPGETLEEHFTWRQVRCDADEPFASGAAVAGDYILRGAWRALPVSWRADPVRFTIRETSDR